MENFILKYPDLLQKKNSTLFKAMEIIDKTNSIVLVVDKNNVLLGTVADSDIRKALLQGKHVDCPLDHVMNMNPNFLHDDCILQDMINKLHYRQHAWFPVVNQKKQVVALYYTKDISGYEHLTTGCAVIMAGGIGSRLMPLTQHKPKPMVKIGGKPILEIIVNNLKKSGLKEFYISVNYLSHIIKDYFGDGQKWGINIEYIEEKKALGTAGPLSLLKPLPKGPLLVTNADLLTQLNYSSLINFHLNEGKKATVSVREHLIQIPFGVVKTNGVEFEGISEKPDEKYLVNAGIYIFEPEIIKLLKKNEYCDIPELLNKINKEFPDSISCFPITEFWLDIGRPEDYELACKTIGNDQ